LGHFVDVRGSQLAIGLQRAQQLALRELKHFQRVLDHHPLPPITVAHQRVPVIGSTSRYNPSVRRLFRRSSSLQKY
jgi:hypothetical protein